MDPIDLAILQSPTPATIIEPAPGQTGYNPNADRFHADAPPAPYGITGLWTAGDVTDGSFTATITFRFADIKVPLTPNQSQVQVGGVTYRVIDLRPRWYGGKQNGWTLKLAK